MYQSNSMRVVVHELILEAEYYYHSGIITDFEELKQSTYELVAKPLGESLKNVSEKMYLRNFLRVLFRDD